MEMSNSHKVPSADSCVLKAVLELVQVAATDLDQFFMRLRRYFDKAFNLEPGLYHMWMMDVRENIGTYQALDLERQGVPIGHDVNLTSRQWRDQLARRYSSRLGSREDGAIEYCAVSSKKSW